MEIQPILASLRKHKIPAFLIVMEIALACAVLCNAVFMIGQRVIQIDLPNAIDESGLSVVSDFGIDPKTASADIPRNLAALRAIPGVTAVASVNSMPLTNAGWNSDVATRPGEEQQRDGANVMLYMMSSGGPDALGLHLSRGRFFNSDEYADSELNDTYMSTGHVVIVTKSLADRLWPGQSPLGKQIYIIKSTYTVVGVVADVLRANDQGQGAGHFYYSAFFPVRLGQGYRYVLRSSPRDRDRVIRNAVQALESLSPSQVIKGQTFAEIRSKYFAVNRSMVWMLVLVCAVMLAVTAFGIAGLTSFWVGQRRRQIGIRRALGATRAHILQYFQTENFLLSSAGVAVGMILAFGINLYLMQHYQLDRMPWYYLPASAVALWVLGQLAVLGPALRAANVPPVVATRSV